TDPTNPVPVTDDGPMANDAATTNHAPTAQDAPTTQDAIATHDAIMPQDAITPHDGPMITLTTAVRERVLALPSDELPAYLYRLSALRAPLGRVRAALPDRVELYYAAKANPEPEILAALGPYVAGYEVASGGELAHVRAAVPGRPLAFGGPGKTPA